jgi:DNA-binding CsgD family transcriptional regulator
VLRLRRLLGRPPVDTDARTEAVLSPAGRVLDARGAVARRSLPSLVDAVRRSERARSRKASHEEKLALWRAMVEGRWSIVESEERDGRRFLLACRNEPRTVALRGLSARERAIAQCAALGHPYKYIAYELGVSVSLVAATLKDVTRKLGLRSRVDLIRTFGTTAPTRRDTVALAESLKK